MEIAEVVRKLKKNHPALFMGNHRTFKTKNSFEKLLISIRGRVSNKR